MCSIARRWTAREGGAVRGGVGSTTARHGMFQVGAVKCLMHLPCAVGGFGAVPHGSPVDLAGDDAVWSLAASGRETMSRGNSATGSANTIQTAWACRAATVDTHRLAPRRR
jgi:hypothetical protein